MVAPTWNCENEACVDVTDGSGIYSTLTECQEACESVFIDDNNLFEINIYPNPSTNFFNIELDMNQLQKTNISITNLLGQEIYNKEILALGKFIETINLTDYPKGLYNLTINSFEKTSDYRIILK